MISDALRPAAEALLVEAGFPAEARLTRVDGGGNNRVFHVGGGGRRAALKAYFHHPQDQRDRLNAEYAFSALAWRHGVTVPPQPLAADRAAHLGLYEFVEGGKLTPETVNAAAVERALDFFAALNGATMRAEGRELPVASEACFSAAAHLATVRRRLERLDGFSGELAVDREAEIFVRDAVQPYWRELEQRVLQALARLGIAADEEIAAEARCISPSDFGFHNALREPSGRLRFIDFEYAGWDDPAKLVGDFFNQVQVPVPQDFLPAFARCVAAQFPDPKRNLARFDILLPVYSVKWITIMLNEFLPVGEMRRSFAGDASEAMARKRRQLAKARQAFARLSACAPQHSAQA